MFGLVAGFFEALGIGAGRWLIATGRGSQADPLMGPNLVVFPTKALEARLLGAERAGRRASGLGLRGAMHTFVATVLFRGAQIDV